MTKPLGGWALFVAFLSGGGCGADGVEAPDAPNANIDASIDGNASVDGNADASPDAPDESPVRYLIAGNHDNKVAVVRHRDNGSLDTEFGTGGGTEIEFAVSASFGAKLDSAGRLLVAALDADSYRPSVVRFTPEGALDLTFAGTGQVITPFQGYAMGVAVRADDAVALATNIFDGGSRVEVHGLTSAGSTDPAFGQAGVTAIPEMTSSDLAHGPAGTLLGAGQDYRTGSEFSAFRLTATGALDPAFGSSGRVVIDVGAPPFSSSIAYAVAWQGERIMVAGATGDSRAVLVALQQDGSLDSTFAGGVVHVDPAVVGRGQWQAVAIQPDGRIVAVGTLERASFDLVVARYTSTGELDPSFGGGAGFVLPGGDGYASAGDVIVDPDGQILVLASDGLTYALIRLEPDGSPDLTFGFGGILVGDGLSVGSRLLRTEITP